MFGLGRAPAPAPADAVPYLPSSPGQQSESAEIAELQQLFSSRGPYPPPRRPPSMMEAALESARLAGA